VKSYEEIMEILEAFDLTGSFRREGAGRLFASHCGGVCGRRDAALLPSPSVPVVRARLIDPFLTKLEEWVERSQGKIRDDDVSDKLESLGLRVRTGRSAGRVEVKANYRTGATAGVSTLDHRTGHVCPVGLGPRPFRCRPADALVVWVAGVV
jgi:hypothetical protein